MWFLKLSVILTFTMHIYCAVLKSEEAMVSASNELINIVPALSNSISIKTDLKSVNESSELIPRSGKFNHQFMSS